MAHERLVRLVRPMNTTDRILGESMTPWQKRIYKDPDPTRAVNWAIKHSQRFPEAEPYILKDPEGAYLYALNVIKGRWPEGEAVIATDSRAAKKYLERFPEAKREWVMRGWLDWFDL